jgi:peptidyl-prolyl cis-trans isomerase B (cyclophilin B)
MANKQIVDYVKKNLSSGFSIEKIKKALLDVGWPEHEINEAINEAKGIYPKKGNPPLPEKSSQKTSVLAILSLIFAFIFCPIGLILGIIALSNIKKNPNIKGRGLAIAGIIISVVFMIIPLILIIIAYSAFSGYLSPASYLPSECRLPMDLSCNDFSIVSGNPGSISLTIENKMGQGIMIRSVNITDNINNKYECYIDLKTQSPGGPNTYQGLDGWHLAHGEEETVKLVCPIEKTNTKTKGDIIINFCDEYSEEGVSNNEECEQFTHTMEGEVLSDIK